MVRLTADLCIYRPSFFPRNLLEKSHKLSDMVSSSYLSTLGALFSSEPIVYSCILFHNCYFIICIVYYCLFF